MNKGNIIDGKKLSQETRIRLKEQAEKFEAECGRKIGLAVVLVGENPASKIYVSNKIKACEEVGLKSFAYYLPETASKQDILNLVEALNDDNSIDGILVQLPLPNKADEKEILARVSPKKDVDGFHAVNAGNLLLGNDSLSACTPSGITRRCVGAKQYRGQTCGYVVIAKRRDCHYMPFEDKKSGADYVAGGHFGGGDRAKRICQKRYGQRGCHCHRRGNEP